MSKAEATAEQVQSRKELSAFLARVAKPVREFGRAIKSEWFSRPDGELKGWIERGRALAEVKDSRWHQLQLQTVDREVKWAQDQLEIGKFDVHELRAYLKALRFVKDYIVTTERNADISSQVLAGRVKEIERVTFVKGGANDRSGNN